MSRGLFRSCTLLSDPGPQTFCTQSSSSSLYSYPLHDKSAYFTQIDKACYQGSVPQQLTPFLNDRYVLYTCSESPRKLFVVDTLTRQIHKRPLIGLPRDSKVKVIEAKGSEMKEQAIDTKFAIRYLNGREVRVRIRMGRAGSMQIEVE